MISCIMASMNREEGLEKVVPSWTKVDKIKDFVIVDWSSHKPLIENVIIQEQIKLYGNIKIIRVENQQYFYRCLAWNLAFQNTNPENKILLKTDAEHINLDDSWMNTLLLDETNSLKDYFYRGLRNTFHLWGCFMANKKNFGKGYNENFDSMWGCEDEDLYRRIIKAFNIEARLFPKNSIGHLNHSFQSKLENLKIKNFYIWKPSKPLQGFSDLKVVDYDYVGLPNRTGAKNFAEWETAKYKVLDDSPTYKRVELIEN